MNVLDLDAALGITSDNDERIESEKALETLIFQALKNWLNYIKTQEIEAIERLEDFDNGTSIPDFLTGIDREKARSILESNFEIVIDDRRDFLALLMALLDGSNEPGSDYLANWKTIQAIREARMERRLGVAAPAHDPSHFVYESRRRRGRPPDVRPVIIAGIRRAVDEGRYTIDQLRDGSISHEALAAEFGCSRGPVRAALNEILGNGEAERS